MTELASSGTAGGPVATTDAEPAAPGVAFVLDGRPAVAEPGEMLISAAERAGTYIPRFCYHPRMKPVGMCRMCLVEVSGPRGATLQPACFIAATEGMEVDTTSAKVKKAQDGVLEFLLVNHPLDCPVCDKGGECPLQDQTLAYGPGESRFVEEKRHFEKPTPISELVLLDRERCIQCARCTRFAEDIAGEAQIDFAGRGEQVEVATFPSEPFSSYFSGNTVQICPVGALTATPYRFTARPWDLDQVESTCTTCALGCRVAVQSSANRLTRLLGIDSEPVNHGWLCDKGRFVFESVNGDEEPAGPDASDAEIGANTAPHGQFAGEVRESGDFASSRLLEPMVRKDGELVPVSWGEALSAAAEGLRSAVDAGGPESVAVLGGARLTNEGAYAWAKLAKGILGTDSVDAQLGDGLDAELVLSLPRATIDETCRASTVILLTGDVREELPVLFLRLREAVLEGQTSLLEITSTPTSLTRYATLSIASRPGDAPTLVKALTGDDSAAAALRSHPEGAAWSDDTLAAARQLVGTGGAGTVVVLGRASLAEDGGLVAEAARLLAQALPGARFLPALRRGNVFGALDMGLAPGILPGRVALDQGRAWFTGHWGGAPAVRGRDAAGILASLADPDSAAGSATAAPAAPVRALVVLGADPAGDFPDADLAHRALGSAEFVVVVTGHRSATVDHAHVVLPASVTHERAGTTTNVEGRVSKLGQKLVAPGFAWTDWMIAAELADALGADLGVAGLADLWTEIEAVAPVYSGLSAVVGESVANDGVVLPLAEGEDAAPTVVPIDPMALPGVESVERQGAPPRVGLAERDLAEHDPTAGADLGIDDAVVASPTPVTLASGPVPGGVTLMVPTNDSYSLRLVSSRRLYDLGSAVSGSPSLSALVDEVVARANPYDLDRLGLSTGDPVRVRSSRADLVMPAHADPSVPKGVVAVDFNLPAGSASKNAAASLIDTAVPVTDVRLESVQ